MGFFKSVAKAAVGGATRTMGIPGGSGLAGGLGSALGSGLIGLGASKFLKAPNVQAQMGNAAGSAMPFLSQIPGVGESAYRPYIDQGQQASAEVSPIYGQMSKDPTEFVNSIMRGYNPSEGYKFKQNQLNRGMQGTAAQGGYAGTPFAQQQQADYTSGLLGGDMQEFLTNVLGVQGAGLAGRESQIQRGYESSGNLSDMLATNLSQQGQLNYAGEGGRQLASNEAAAYNSAQKQGQRNAMLDMMGSSMGRRGY